MLVKQFKFKRNHDKGGFQWTAESETKAPGVYRGFHAAGKTLADVKEFAALVRYCERTGTLERLSEMHPDGFEDRMQTMWGGLPNLKIRCYSLLLESGYAPKPNVP